MKPTKVLVLLSGGQDSTTCLFWARDKWPDAELHALSADYGQRHIAELDAAEAVAKLAGVKTWRVVDLSSAFGAGSGALVNHTEELKGDGGIPDAAMPQGLPTSFVPGRNLVLLAAAGARAGELGCQHVVTGICQTDYSGYPDCREEFREAMQAAITLAMPSELRPVFVHAPLMDMSKAETCAMMYSIAGGKADHPAWMALAVSVTCYNGSIPGCGTCPSCNLRLAGFVGAGLVDPQLDPAMEPVRSAFKAPAKDAE